MEKELDKTVRNTRDEYNRQLKVSDSGTCELPISPCGKHDEQSDDGDTKERLQKNISNDDLFFDPDMDSRDEQWINKIRNQYQQSNNQSFLKQAVPPSNSDAVLNCPACMGLLCVDCQRYFLSKNGFIA